MSTFTAANIEYDNVSDEEIDDTKEIQIEDALKLYQTALRYHSEGPKSYAKADRAYRELFESEIFKYPESQSEFRREELLGPVQDYDELWHDHFQAGPVALVAAGESAPNTLPQILYLAYKNRGQLCLDMLQYNMQHDMKNLALEPLTSVVLHAAGPTLHYFAEALDKDDTDLDLWGRASAVASLLGSSRISRYCMEAVLDDEDEGVNGVLALPGLEEGFAVHALKRDVQRLQDDLALRLSPLSKIRKKQLSDAIMQRLDPYKTARVPIVLKPTPNFRALLGKEGERIMLRVAQRNWTSVGEAILRHYQSEQSGFGPRSGVAISFNMPAREPGAESPSPVVQTGDTVLVESPKANGDESAKNDAAMAETEAQPTKQESSATADVEMTESPVQADSMEASKEASAQTAAADGDGRKRSSESAGLPEEAEGGRLRSKRLKARESIAESSKNQDQNAQQQAEDLLQPFNQADQILYEVAGSLFERLGVTNMSAAELIKETNEEAVQSPTVESDLTTAMRDLRDVSESCVPEVVRVFLSKNDPDPLAGSSREAGLSAFLGYAKSENLKSPAKPRFSAEARLDQWIDGISTEWKSIPEVALSWINTLLQQRIENGSIVDSSYRAFQWSDELKQIMVHMIVHLDQYVYGQSLDSLSALDKAVLGSLVGDGKVEFSSRDKIAIEMVQTLFELHLDIYSLIKQPGSTVDAGTQISQHDRLERWSALAHQAHQLRATLLGGDPMDELTIRHLWAAAYHLDVCDDVAQDHVILCMQQLKALLQVADGMVIELQNNAVMPELSVEAINREMSRIQMKDFFIKVFNDDDTDPVSTIEGLEPILEASLTPVSPKSRQRSVTGSAHAPDVDQMEQEASPEEAAAALNSASLKAASSFLDDANISLRLSLWHRLREAYEAINYPPKVLSCYLRCIELLTGALKSVPFLHAPTEQRHFMLLRWLKLIDIYLNTILKSNQAEYGLNDNLECLDEDHLQSSLSSLVDLSRLLHTFTVYEDHVRVKLVPAPVFEGRPSSSYPLLIKRMRSMRLRLWTLMYQLLKEGMSQRPDFFPNAEQDCFEYLRAVHHAVGVRNSCKSTKSIFLALQKYELHRMKKIEGRDLELAQVFYDLYGLKCIPNEADLVDHDPKAETAPMPPGALWAGRIAHFLIAQVKKTPLKDLPKLELKDTIEKVHGALARPMPNDDVALNKKMYASYIKSPVAPLELFRCLSGVVSIVARPVAKGHPHGCPKGWYFVMGDVAFNRYVAQKQKSVQSVPTEDLNTAIIFFNQELEYRPNRWEAWYRLALCYDLQLEDAVLWSAEKVNSNAHEIVQIQRAAIHCYTMAVASSTNELDTSGETTKKIAKLYVDFGTRIYSCSREPFSMSAFALQPEEIRFMSNMDMGQEPVRSVAFVTLTEYAAWKLAAGLFKRAIAREPDYWWSHYMLGKCLWKMYTADESVRNSGRPTWKPNSTPELQEVVDGFTSAIEALPRKRDLRKEPILEPHYKLVSIAHKLVLRKAMDIPAAAELLQTSEFLRKVEKPSDDDGWESYILQILKVLRSVDKPGWHHRMTARAVHVIYDDNQQNDKLAAMGAKHELTQQMFTKTMAVQVWKPENERPGRHFVYMTRYTRFFFKLLVELEDRASMELLAKRVRRRPNDFYNHLQLWTELCGTYLKLLRRWGRIPEGHEDAVFKSLNHEEFVRRAIHLEAWCQDEETEKTPVYDVLKDVIELKRTNNGHIKATLIDDLVGDTYAALYAQFGGYKEDEPLPAHYQAQLEEFYEQQQAAQFAGQDGPGRPRTKGVGRREIQKRAEAAVTPHAKPTAAAAAAAAAVPARPTGGQTVQVVIPPRTTTAATTITNTSMHDSADESELSELQDEEEAELEEIVVKPMFPNLSKSREAGSTDAGSGRGTPATEENKKSDEQDDDNGDEKMVDV